MKLPEVKEFINHWPKSLTFLKESALAYFKQNDIPTENVWFPDIEIIIPDRLISQENIQVVLFGGFLDRIFESGNWADKKFTFWCLSPKVKNVMVEMLKFPSESISVIPRYDLVNKNSIERKVDLNSDLEIVYSGRLSSQKNIEMFLAFSSILQERLNQSVSILLLGEWGNEGPKNRGRFVIDSYQEVVETFQKKLHFKKDPLIVSHLNHDEWLNTVGANSLMVNFSTYYCEDFGVAVAQAQSAGIPMILSKWGAHGDVNAENILWVDKDDIAESFSLDEKILLKAQILVEKFLNQKLEVAKAVIYSANSKIQFLSLSDIHHLRQAAMKKHGYALGLLGQDWMSLFADSSSGKEFFKQYSLIFSGKSQ